MQHSHPQGKHACLVLPLYRVVFSGRPVIFVLFILLLSFFLQPIEQALASEVAAPESSSNSVQEPLVISESLAVENEEVVIMADESVHEKNSESTIVDVNSTSITEVIKSEVIEHSTSSSHVVDHQLIATTTESIVTLSALESNSVGTTSELISIYDQESQSTSTDVVLESQSTSTDVVSRSEITPPPSVVELASNTEAFVLDIIGTTTEATSTEYLPLSHSSYNDNEIRFDKEQCNIVGDGSYYCRPKSVDTSVRDGLIAAPDDDGDLEIFAVRGGEYIQLTFNTVDDASPYYDSESDTMVWHRLLDDHYQIFSYDFKTKKESRFTDGGVNDMEPSRFGDFTVWQRWVDGHWHIMLDDGSVIMQLSKTSTHHIAPNIRGQIVLWQTTGEDGEKELQTFDLVTKSYLTITDSEDASMINPRMMMVYEAVYDSGEVVTRGFDMLTGKIIPLHSASHSVPENLPESDSTGETRALIQSKPALKEVEIETEPEPAPDINIGNVSVIPMTLDLSTTTVAVSSSSTLIPDVFTPDISFDLYIPASSTQVLPEN